MEITEEKIAEIVKLTISEYRRQEGLEGSRGKRTVEYQEAIRMITDYYSGRGSKKVGEALREMSQDAYFKILPKYFRDGMTLEQLSIAFDCEPITISRNKKRLCLEVLRRVK